MKSTSLHTAIGLFLLIGFGCIAYLTLVLANTNLFTHTTYSVVAKFSAVNGLRVGSNVEISGVYVGKVTNISLDQKLYQSVVTMQIQKSILIPSDSSASVKTSGLIGDKYISITPGGNDVALKDNETIVDTQAAIDIEDMISKYVFGSVNK